MINRAECERLRERLLTVLEEDAHNEKQLLERLEAICREGEASPHAALLRALAELELPEEQARERWEAILAHRERMSRALGREVGVRAALLDHALAAHRRAIEPWLVRLRFEPTGGVDPERDLQTGLASVKHLRAQLDAEIRRARRYGLQVSLVVAAFDRSEPTPDDVVHERRLRELARLVRHSIRDIDLAARTDVNEVTFLLPETERNGGLLVAERLRRRVEAHFQQEAPPPARQATISAGVASYPDDASTPEALLESARQALDLARAVGRNTVHLYHRDSRRYLRFDLEPERFEVEVLHRSQPDATRTTDLSRNGILFRSPEPLEIGESIEIRVTGEGQAAPKAGESRPLRIRGRVVRLEELPLEEAADGSSAAANDRYEVGVAFDLGWAEGTNDLIAFLERVRAEGPQGRS